MWKSLSSCRYDIYGVILGRSGSTAALFGQMGKFQVFSIVRTPFFESEDHLYAHFYTTSRVHLLNCRNFWPCEYEYCHFQEWSITKRQKCERLTNNDNFIREVYRQCQGNLQYCFANVMSSEHVQTGEMPSIDGQIAFHQCWSVFHYTVAICLPGANML